MAIWNSCVRGNVIAIKTHMGWDPTEIVDASNPMPTPDNPAGLGRNMGAVTEAPVPTFKSTKVDAGRVPPLGKRGGDPNAGKGKF